MEVVTCSRVVEFFRRSNDDALVETRLLVNRFKSAEELCEAFTAYVAADAPEAYVLYRELDYFEQLAALAAGYEDHGAPGERAVYHPGYYGAFVLDPDGHNVEVVNHNRD